MDPTQPDRGQAVMSDSQPGPKGSREYPTTRWTDDLRKVAGSDWMPSAQDRES